MATLRDEGDRTRIRCRFGMHPKMIFILMTSFFVCILLGGGFLTSPSHFHDAGVNMPKIFAAVGILSNCLAFFRGRYLARNDQVFILDVVQKTLSAQVVSA
jgi:hypothetical protein